LASAAQLAAKISPRQAFPFERSRTWCLVVLLLIAVAGSMLLRYARLGGLDLRAPVIHFALPQQSVAAAREIVKNLLKKPQQPIPSPLQPTLAEPDVDSSGRGAGSKDPSEAIRNLERQFEAGQKSGASENLLDRLGDTLRGLGSEVKQSLARNQRAANREGSGREQAQKNDGSDAASQSSSKPSSSDPAASQNQDQSGEQQSAKAEARAIEKQNGSPLGPADQAAQQKGSDAQSGAGRDEGQKTIQNAEQLKAIGKLEQIIGKRSAAITGEMRLAKSSHDQQLQTQYSNRVGEHSDRGGEIHHDQVPPEYRDYIRAYMDAEHAANHDH
jgi:hypothetical protein